MRKIETTGIVLNVNNIDTDQIIPAKFLKATSRDGFGKNLFYNWRYDEKGEPNPTFALNSYPREAGILIAGNNFGCGSSREHAAWAIADYGISAVISCQFADIFKGNALNNSIIPIELHEQDIKILMNRVESFPTTTIVVDIEAQQVKVQEEDFSFCKDFQIDQLKKKFIMEGISDLEYMESIKNEIQAFEEAQVI